MRRSKTVTAAFCFIEREFVIPAAELRTGCWEARAQTPRLKETIFIQPKKNGLGLLELRLRETGCKLYIRIIKLFQGTRRLIPGSCRESCGPCYGFKERTASWHNQFIRFV